MLSLYRVFHLIRHAGSSAHSREDNSMRHVSMTNLDSIIHIFNVRVNLHLLGVGCQCFFFYRGQYTDRKSNLKYHLYFVNK